MADKLRADIASARARINSRAFGSVREMRKLPDYLAEGEEVRVLAAGTFSGGQGLLAMTDRRVLFLRDGLMGKAMEDFALEKISSVSWKAGILLGTIQLTVSGNRAEVLNLDKHDGQTIADAIRGAINTSAPGAAPAAGAASGGPDIPTQLLQLKTLLDAGAVTSEEYDAKKADLLSRF